MIEKTHFESQLVEDKDRYWIEGIQTSFNDLDIISTGLEEGEIKKCTASNEKSKRIAKYEGPIAIQYGDINGNGRQDLIVCYQYGATMVTCHPQGGKIDWLQNPGSLDGEWKRHHIGKSTAMHRLRLGHFTQNQKLEVLGFPTVGGPNDPHRNVSIKLFTQPESLENATQWNQQTIDNTHFRVLREISVGRYNRLFGIECQSNLESVILASEEGTTWIYYSLTEKKWIFFPLINSSTSKYLKTQAQIIAQCQLKQEINTRDIPFGKNIHGTWIQKAKSYQIRSRTIVINLGNKTPTVQATPIKKILPKTSVILLKNTIITNVHSLLLIQVDEKLDFMNIHKQSDWKLLSELDPSFDKSIQLYKSGQFDLGEIQFDPNYLCGESENQDILKRKRYNLKVNFWYCPPSTDCGIHIRHVEPHDFLEIHTQIYGTGRMQKFHEKKFQTLYYDRPLSPGQTHEPFASLIDGQFIYPWHQYYSDSDCIWIANQFHVL